MRKLTFAAVLLPLAIAGCVQSTPPGQVTNSAVADPAAGIRSLQSPQFIAGFEQRAVTDPAPWRSLNDAQAPEEGEN